MQDPCQSLEYFILSPNVNKKTHSKCPCEIVAIHPEILQLLDNLVRWGRAIYKHLYHDMFCLGFPGWLSSRVCLQRGRCGFHPWVRKIPWRRKWQTTPVFLPGKSYGQRSLVGCSSQGSKESDTTEHAHIVWIQCLACI